MVLQHPPPWTEPTTGRFHVLRTELLRRRGSKDPPTDLHDRVLEVSLAYWGLLPDLGKGGAEAPPLDPLVFGQGCSVRLGADPLLKLGPKGARTSRDQQDWHLHNTVLVLNSPEHCLRGAARVCCTACGRSDTVTSDGHTGLKRFLSLGCARSFMMRRRYRCRDCTAAKGGPGHSHSFSAHDPKVLSKWPDHVRLQLPFTYVAGVGHMTHEVKDLIDVLALKCSGAVIRNSVEALLQRDWDRRALVYYGAIDAEDQVARESAAARQPPITDFLPRNTPDKMTPKFDDFESKMYKSFMPKAASYVNDAIVSGNIASVARAKARMAQTYDSRGIVAADHSHKAVKKISGGGMGIYTILSGDGQVLGQQRVASTSQGEVADLTRDVAERAAKAGRPVKAIYVDNGRTVGPQLMQQMKGVVVKEDSTHAMRRVISSYVPLNELAGPAAKTMSGAIFVMDAAAKAEYIKKLQLGGLSAAAIGEKTPAHFCKHVRRCISPPEELLPRMQKAFDDFLDAHDTSTNVLLYTDATHKAWEAIVRLVREDKLSDIPGLDMYMELPSGGLRCLRGTSALEGYHRWLNLLFHGTNLSEELADTLLHLFNDMWNSRALGLIHGVRKVGNHDPWLQDKLEELLVRMDLPAHFPDVRSRLPKPSEVQLAKELEATAVAAQALSLSAAGSLQTTTAPNTTCWQMSQTTTLPSARRTC